MPQRQHCRERSMIRKVRALWTYVGQLFWRPFVESFGEVKESGARHIRKFIVVKKRDLELWPRLLCWQLQDLQRTMKKCYATYCARPNRIALNLNPHDLSLQKPASNVF